MKVLKTLLFALLAVVVITFSIKNAGNVRFRYFNLIDSFETPLFLLVLVSILFGVLVGAMMDLIKRYELKKAIRREQKIMDELRKEVSALRSLILTGPEDEKGKEV